MNIIKYMTNILTNLNVANKDKENQIFFITDI